MVPSSDRIAKFLAKNVPDTIRDRLAAMMDIGNAKYTAQADTWAAREDQWLIIMNNYAIVQVDRPKHYNFAREMWAKVDNGVFNPALTSQVLAELVPKYVAGFGCDIAVLRQLAIQANVPIP
jgi:hypothetical protein